MNGVAEVSQKYLVEPSSHDISAGYKQTEVGIIPEEWDVQTGRELFSKIQDGTHFSPKIRGGEFLYVTSKNIKFGYLDLNSAEYIDRAQHEAIYKRCDVRRNDILLTKDGANTGNAALNFLDEPFSLLSSVAFLRLDNEKHSPAFFLQQFLSSEFQRYIQEEMSGNAITRLTLQKINNLKFYVPPRHEQTAIANALSDVDALISELEKLIAKKQAIKTATMQQLLTGRTRLPQFALREDGTPKGTKPSELGEIPEDWEVVELGSVARLYQPETISGSDLKDSGFPVYGANGLIGFFDRFNHCESEVIVTCRGSTCGTVNITVPQSWITGNAMVVDTSERKALGKIYAFFLLGFHDLTICISGSGQPQIVRSPLAAFKIQLPSRDEQTAIATILSDMDAEIQALEQRLGKTRQIKQGMMQELLTGKTRLMQPQNKECQHG